MALVKLQLEATGDGGAVTACALLKQTELLGAGMALGITTMFLIRGMGIMKAQVSI